MGRQRVTQRKLQRGGCLGRMVGVAAAAVLVAVPVALALPAEAVSAVLAAAYPGDGWDLSDPMLIDGWRWLLGGLAGVVTALALLVLGGLARRARRPVARRDAPEVLLAKALRAGDMAGVCRCAEQLGAQAGAEAVPALMAALEAPLDDEARRAVAAALYRLGRAVTAEISPRPPRI